QRIENPCVGGSIPPRATRFSKAYISVSLFYFLQLQVDPTIVEDFKNIILICQASIGGTMNVFCLRSGHQEPGKYHYY
ncbi:MAG: hypothetical protein ABI536_07665, partial [Gallionella sp.]